MRGRRVRRRTHEPSLAEFLDAVAAVVTLGLQDDERWQGIVEYTLAKPGPA